jgi:hypothetical protein
MGPWNWFQGMNSASLCSLARRYKNPIPPRCLATIDFLKIPALDSPLVKYISKQRRLSKPSYMQTRFCYHICHLLMKEWKEWPPAQLAGSYLCHHNINLCSVNVWRASSNLVSFFGITTNKPHCEHCYWQKHHHPKMYLIQSPVHIQDDESPCETHLLYDNIIILIIRKSLYLHVIDALVIIYTVKKGNDFPVPSRYVTNQTLPGRELLNYSRQGRVCLVTSRLGTGELLTFFTV